MGRHKKHDTEEERLEAKREYSKKWYNKNKHEKPKNKCAFKHEECNEIKNHIGGTYCQYHAQVMAKSNKYKIPPNKVLELYKINNCVICNTNLEGKRCIDHNHKTGNVRNVICHNCNVVIGMVKEKTEVLESIIKSFVGRGFNIKAAIEFEKFKMGA